MSFDWSEYLIAAKFYAQFSDQPPTDEAALRIAIGRAYYAAFNIARNFVEQVDGVVLPDVDVHNTISNYFGRSSDRNRVRIGQMLRTMRKNRNQADYDNTISNLQRKAEETIRQAEQIIRILERLP